MPDWREFLTRHTATGGFMAEENVIYPGEMKLGQAVRQFREQFTPIAVADYFETEAGDIPWGREAFINKFQQQEYGTAAAELSKRFKIPGRKAAQALRGDIKSVLGEDQADLVYREFERAQSEIGQRTTELERYWYSTKRGFWQETSWAFDNLSSAAAAKMPPGGLRGISAWKSIESLFVSGRMEGYPQVYFPGQATMVEKMPWVRGTMEALEKDAGGKIFISRTAPWYEEELRKGAQYHVNALVAQATAKRNRPVFNLIFQQPQQGSAQVAALIGEGAPLQMRLPISYATTRLPGGRRLTIQSLLQELGGLSGQEREAFLGKWGAGQALQRRLDRFAAQTMGGVDWSGFKGLSADEARYLFSSRFASLLKETAPGGRLADTAAHDMLWAGFVRSTPRASDMERAMSQAVDDIATSVSQGLQGKHGMTEWLGRAASSAFERWKTNFYPSSMGVATPNWMTTQDIYQSTMEAMIRGMGSDVGLYKDVAGFARGTGVGEEDLYGYLFGRAFLSGAGGGMPGGKAVSGEMENALRSYLRSRGVKSSGSMVSDVRTFLKGKKIDPRRTLRDVFSSLQGEGYSVGSLDDLLDQAENLEVRDFASKMSISAQKRLMGEISVPGPEEALGTAELSTVREFLRGGFGERAEYMSVAAHRAAPGWARMLAASRAELEKTYTMYRPGLGLKTHPAQELAQIPTEELRKRVFNFAMAEQPYWQTLTEGEREDVLNLVQYSRYQKGGVISDITAQKEREIFTRLSQVAGGKPATLPEYAYNMRVGGEGLETTQRIATFLATGLYSEEAPLTTRLPGESIDRRIMQYIFQPENKELSLIMEGAKAGELELATLRDVGGSATFVARPSAFSMSLSNLTRFTLAAQEMSKMDPTKWGFTDLNAMLKSIGEMGITGAKQTAEVLPRYFDVHRQYPEMGLLGSYTEVFRRLGAGDPEQAAQGMMKNFGAWIANAIGRTEPLGLDEIAKIENVAVDMGRGGQVWPANLAAIYGAIPPEQAEQGLNLPRLIAMMGTEMSDEASASAASWAEVPFRHIAGKAGLYSSTAADLAAYDDWIAGAAKLLESGEAAGGVASKTSFSPTLKGIAAGVGALLLVGNLLAQMKKPKDMPPENMPMTDTYPTGATGLQMPLTYEMAHAPSTLVAMNGSGYANMRPRGVAYDVQASMPNPPDVGEFMDQVNNLFSMESGLPLNVNVQYNDNRMPASASRLDDQMARRLRR